MMRLRMLARKDSLAETSLSLPSKECAPVSVSVAVSFIPVGQMRKVSTLVSSRPLRTSSGPDEP